MAKTKGENPYIKLVPSNGGRPQKILTDEGKRLVFTLSKLMATDEEIADALSDDNEKITVDTLTNSNNKVAFSENKRKGQSSGKASLRAWQFASAKKGSVPMQIFLGKNYLGQTDKAEDTTDKGSKGININIRAATPLDVVEDNEE